ncbi:MAG TPA: accessory factor UbiK family protein [Burkholderiales bacterium]
MPTNPIEEIMQALARFLPQTPQDVKQNIRAALAAVLDRLDLVTREELEVQEAVLARTRARLEEMERRVAALEEKLARK